MGDMRHTTKIEFGKSGHRRRSGIHPRAECRIDAHPHYGPRIRTALLQTQPIPPRWPGRPASETQTCRACQALPLDFAFAPAHHQHHQ